MLPREHRLRRHRDVLAVVRHGRSVPGRTLVLHVQPRTTAPTQFAVLVSKHVAKHAVDRNRVKRRVRAALAPLQRRVQPPVAILVRIRRNALSRSTDELRQELERLLTRLHLLT